MPSYDFHCKTCNTTEVQVFSMADTKGRDSAKCPTCGSKVKRVFNTVAAVVKTSLKNSGIQLKKNERIINVDGRPVKLNFVDHGDRSGLDSRSIGNKMPGARMDEKSGRMVVDVVSSIPDPLGAMERSKKNSRQETLTKKINTKTRSR